MKKKNWSCAAAFTLILGLLIIFPCPSFSMDEIPIIDIQAPFLRKIPIAIPAFVFSGEQETLRDVGEKGGEYFAGAVDFSGYFMVQSAHDKPGFPTLDGIVASKIDFSIWKKQGVELLTSIGLVLAGDGQLEMECRLFDVIQESLVVGKRYRGPVSDFRRMFRLFASEVLFQVTGRQGLYESRLAFVSDTTGHKEIYICDYDCTGVRQITRDQSIALSPAWSSDGNWLAYTSYREGNPDLFIKHLDGGRGVHVSKPGLNITPAWVPGAFQLAATLSFEGHQNIYLLTGHGKVIKKLTHSWDIDVSPAFSPDGKQMAFVSRRSGSPQIYLKNMESGRVQRLTFEGNYNTSPAFSPDGRNLAFVGMRRGEGINIYRMDLDGQRVVQLTQNSRDNEDPTWSPDGSLIAFTSSREGVFNLYVMTAYGTDQRRLLSMPGAQTTPRWSLKPVRFE
ncbi:Tol-Pal system beta propeller repeat protein TolB [Desulfobotulus mexicanus]|uniref:Tol-Pal system beta propeller repeat protein TolB n=1 Tax=Desulfobotulus mexicanus TaxID=2586642 RepID=A0A5Q4VBD5_9BACT|nr:Tol-Pal system beta propeller repeat protein TolB [Desulfobotulus mexicanus]TYT75054.1 Tol-Pal system beta propeller repeat protein TolB [Desulfobotulus mexicanus]